MTHVSKQQGATLGPRILTLTAIASLALSACLGLSREEKFFSACDATMKERLKAPSTYRVLERSEIYYTPYDLQWAFGLRNDREEDAFLRAVLKNGPWPDFLREKYSATDIAKTRDMLRAQMALVQLHINDGYQVAVASVRYDAENSYGTPIAGTFACEIETPQNALPGEIDPDNIRVDGQTRFEWSMSLFK